MSALPLHRRGFDRLPGIRPGSPAAVAEGARLRYEADLLHLRDQLSLALVLADRTRSRARRPLHAESLDDLTKALTGGLATLRCLTEED